MSIKHRLIKLILKFYRLFSALLGRKFDINLISSRALQRNFYKVNCDRIQSTLQQKKIIFFDVGARGGLDSGLNKYRDILDIYVSEPDPKAFIKLESKGYTAVKSLIGRDNRSAVLNICKAGGLSSILQPSGKFSDLYARGDVSIFDIVKTIKLKTETISSIFNNSRDGLDLLKMDVQGFENKVIDGLVDVRPLIIETEISFVPLYKDSAIFFELGKKLYDMGYILFHLSYHSRNSYGKYLTNETNFKNRIPVSGDAWFMPDWTRKEGVDIIKGREHQWSALMLMFGMEDILNYARDKIKT